MESEENKNTPPENDLEDTKPRKALPPQEQPPVEDKPTSPVNPASEAPVDETRPVLPAADAFADTHAVPPVTFNESGFSETLPPPDDFTAPVPPRRPAVKAGGKPPVKKVTKKRRSFKWLLWPLAGVALLILVAVVAAGLGYGSGIGLRKAAASTQAAGSALDQFQRGLEDMGKGNYYTARQRFEYVIRLDPNFPGAAEKLAEAIMYLDATATPTVQATPTITPTPDTRAVEELWNQAQSAMASKDWNAAVESLLALRAKDINYHVVDVDGMLFVALRNRGYAKITQTDLESGIYDLTLASNFGPLDSEAEGLMSWSQMYITGASFWGIDWQQVIDYFSQVAPQMPNLMDGSGMTATERLRQAYFEYGNTLAASEPCKAVELYQQSLAIAPNAEVEAALNTAAGACGGGGGGNTTGEPQKTPKKNKTPKP
jgi:tetratricopeptide (TPR) repeat protein